MASLIRSAKPGQASARANRHISTVLNYITVEFGRFDGMAVRPEWIHTGSVDAQHVLRLQVFDFADSGRLTLAFDCNSEAFDGATRAAIPGHFLRPENRERVADVDRRFFDRHPRSRQQTSLPSSSLAPRRLPTLSR